MKLSIMALSLTILLAGLTAACQPAGPQLESGDTPYEEKGNTGDVSFTLVPRGIENGRFVVDFRVDTHSGDLSEIDLTQAAALRVGEMEYSPVEATALSGHHVRGDLAFAIAEAPDEFQIVIMDVRDMGDLEFEWTS